MGVSLWHYTSTGASSTQSPWHLSKSPLGPLTPRIPSDSHFGAAGSAIRTVYILYWTSGLRRLSNTPSNLCFMNQKWWASFSFPNSVVVCSKITSRWWQGIFPASEVKSQYHILHTTFYSTPFHNTVINVSNSRDAGTGYRMNNSVSF